MNKHFGICLLRYILAFIAGVALSFAYAPTNIGLLAWFFPAALVGLIWSIPKDQLNWKRNWGRGFRVAYIAGIGFWLRDASFIGQSAGDWKWLIAVVVALYLGLFFAVYGGWAATLGRWSLEPWGKTAEERAKQPKPNYAVKILLLGVMHAFLWCGLEWLRGLGRVSFGWDGLGVSFMDSAFVMAQSADIIGVNGLSFMIVLGGVVLVQTVKTFHMEATYGYRRAHWEVGLTLTLFCLNFLYGTYRLGEIRKTETFPVRALIIQRNISLDNFLGYSDYPIEQYTIGLEDAFTEIEERSVETLNTTGRVKIELPDIVLLPENALSYPIWADSDRDILLKESLELSEQGVPLFSKVESFYDEIEEKYPPFLFIAGITEYAAYIDEQGLYFTDLTRGEPQIDLQGNFYNGIGFFDDDFKNLEVRDKNHLMPFGEYVPVEGAFKYLFNFFSGQQYTGSFTAGTKFEPYNTEIDGQKLSIIPVVCYEDTVSSIARKYIREEAQLMVNVTNDGWFAGTHCGEKHFQNARFRAIEYRRPLLRSANTGLTGAIQASGSNLHPVTGVPQELRNKAGNYEVTGHLETLTLVPKQSITTIYRYIGNILCWGGGLIVLGWSMSQIMTRKG